MEAMISESDMGLNCLIFNDSPSLSSVGKESACSAGDPGSIPGSERSRGEGNGNLLQYSCLGNPMDRGAWQAIVHGVIRVGHDLATKPPPPTLGMKLSYQAVVFLREAQEG